MDDFHSTKLFTPKPDVVRRQVAAHNPWTLTLGLHLALTPSPNLGVVVVHASGYYRRESAENPNTRQELPTSSCLLRR